MRVLATYFIVLFSVFEGLTVCRLPHNDSKSSPAAVYPSVAHQIEEQYPMPISVSHDGSRMLLRSNDWNTEKLSIVDSRTKQVLAWIESPNAHLATSWSVDDKEIAFLSGEGNSDEYHLFVWKMAESTPRLIDSPKTNTAIQSVRWSPDGTRLAYLVGSNDDATIWVVNTEKLNEGTSLVAHVRPLSDFEWSPDSKLVAAVFRYSPATLSILDGKDGGIVRTAQVSATPVAEIRDISWAPSGYKLALSARTDEFFSLFGFDLQTNDLLRCASPGGKDTLAPHFAADGKTLVYSLSVDAQIVMYASSCAASQATRLGFASGTTRFLRLLNGSINSSATKGSLAVLHSGLDEPPGLYKVSIQTGNPSLIFSPPSASRLRSAAPQTISLRSTDGIDIPAVLWRATNPTSLLPVTVVDVHGGLHLQKYRRWEFLPYLLNKSGIDVVSPNFRGSEGYGFRFEQSDAVRGEIDDVLAACKYARSLHGAKSKVILLGTSYGSLLAATAAAKDSRDIDGVILVSMIPRTFSKSSSGPFKLPFYCFQGQNDSQPPDKVIAALKSLFGPSIFEYRQHEWRVFPNEGHVFRLTSSWAEVYSGILRMSSSISQNKSEAIPAG
jgi:dipeptidyl aminopeptidase/acylaminoacyl peptidase